MEKGIFCKFKIEQENCVFFEAGLALMQRMHLTKYITTKLIVDNKYDTAYDLPKQLCFLTTRKLGLNFLKFEIE